MSYNIEKDPFDYRFSKLYEFIKKNSDSSEFYRLLNFSILRIFLITKGKSEMDDNSYSFKSHLVSLLEVCLSFLQLAKIKLKNLSGKKNRAIIMVIEPTHLNQVLGITGQLAKYNPIYVTDKRRYLKVLREKLGAKDVLLIPQTFVMSTEVTDKKLDTLFKDFEMDVPETLVHNIAGLASMGYGRYRMMKWIFSVLASKHLKFSFVFNDLTFSGRVATYLLNKTSCKTIYVMHGLLSDEFIETMHIAGKYFIYGDYTREVLLKKGIANEDILTVGTPYLEYYLSREKPLSFVEEVENKYSKDKKILLILLSGRGHTTSKTHHEMIIKLLGQLIADRKDSYHFIFKLHKKDYKEHYNELLENPAINPYFDIYAFDHFNERESIFDWIRMCDLIITGASTTALEAMYLGKPVITVDLMREYEHETPYITNGGTYHSRNREELYTHLDNLYRTNFTIKEEAININKNYFSSSEVLHHFFDTEFERLVS